MNVSFRSGPKVPHLVTFLFRHAAIGTLAAVGFVALLYLTDTGKIATLVNASSVGWLALAVMTVFFAITFGSVQMGIALMLESNRPSDGGARRGRPVSLYPLHLPALAPVRARRR